MESKIVLSRSIRKWVLLVAFFHNWQESTWRLNGCHGYQTKVTSQWNVAEIARVPYLRADGWGEKRML